MDPADIKRNVHIESARITSAERTTAPSVTLPDATTLDNLPPRTVVKIVLNPAPGSRINVELWLPDPSAWNGRFSGHGNGGSAGSILISPLAGACRRGYAAATTDMGTAPDEDSGINNPEVWKDFGYRATHLMTTSAKTVITAFYGRPPEHSYFLGGSTGGQQAMQEAQRYPDDYDGIVAAVPAHCRTPLHAYFLWNEQILTECPFTETQEQSVIAAANTHFAPRELSQTAGKIVSDPRSTPDDHEAIITLAQKNDPTLTPAHAAALRKIFSGPVHEATGEQVFGGVPPGTPFLQARGHLYLFRWVFGKQCDTGSINFGKDLDAYTAALAPHLDAEDPDLRPFERQGGKLIMYSGSADPIVPYHATLNYYERMVACLGSPDRVKSFFRYYLIPGRGHGVAAGPGVNTMPDDLELIVQWREHGNAPQMLRCQRLIENTVELDLSVYPYPEKPVSFKPA